MSSEIIRQEAVQAFEKIQSRLDRLERNDYFRPIQKTGAVSNPPTLAEITALFGTPASYNSEVTGILKNTGSGEYWFIFGDRVNWFYNELAIAL